MTLTPFADLLIWRLFSAAWPFTKRFKEQRSCQKKQTHSDRLMDLINYNIKRLWPKELYLQGAYAMEAYLFLYGRNAAQLFLLLILAFICV
jgi:hypothetical protein